MEQRSESDQYSDESCDENGMAGSPQILETLGVLKEEERMVISESHPDLKKRFEKIEKEFKYRKSFNESCYALEMRRIERWKEVAIESVQMDARRQEQELQESLLAELDEKKRMLDLEKASMDLSVSGDVFDSKPTTTRKLRRRLHDNNNSNAGESVSGLTAGKRKKATNPSPAEGIKYLLDESDINDDLRRIFRHSSKGGGSVSSVSSVRKSQASANDDGPGGLPGLTPSGDEHSIYIDDGRLYYDHKWFTKNQNVFILGKDAAQHKIAAVITQISIQDLHLKRQTDLGKMKITLQQLKAGKLTLKKRS